MSVQRSGKLEVKSSFLSKWWVLSTIVWLSETFSCATSLLPVEEHRQERQEWRVFNTHLSLVCSITGWATLRSTQLYLGMYDVERTLNNFTFHSLESWSRNPPFLLNNGWYPLLTDSRKPITWATSLLPYRDHTVEHFPLFLFADL